MLDWIRDVTGARSARRVARIQSLWSGYGEIVRVALDGGPAPTVIVKHVRPRAPDSVGDRRKRASYDNEIMFYRQFAPRCDATCRVAKLYGARATGDEWLLVLEDLGDKPAPPLAQCLAWLASFHRRFIDVREKMLEAQFPGQGTYWHLATRQEELARIADPVLRARAPELAAQLASAPFPTLLHGDAKEENFIGDAAVDFQYAGIGCAMSDVAYLLHGNGDHHLDTYFRALASPELETAWRPYYEIAKLDFERFLAGWSV